jgi:beta-glucosidase
MCAYNAVNGSPACASPMLLRDHLREDWHFDGYVVSDCAAVADVATGHKFAPDFAHASAAAIKAGTDLECQYGQGTAFAALSDSVKQGLITEADLDRAVKRLFTARFRLGMFDPAESYAYGRIAVSEVNSAEHRKLALRAAREAIVLLKNDRGLLPLSENTRSIAVVGPTAELVQSLQGNYNGTPPDPVSPIAGIERRLQGREDPLRARIHPRRGIRRTHRSHGAPHGRRQRRHDGRVLQHSRFRRETRRSPRGSHRQLQLG